MPACSTNTDVFVVVFQERFPRFISPDFSYHVVSISFGQKSTLLATSVNLQTGGFFKVSYKLL